MGGSFGGGSRSRQSSSRSYGAPSRSSGGYSGGRSYGAPSRGHSRGYSSGYYPRQNGIVSPRIGGSLLYSLFSPISVLPSGVIVRNYNPFGRILLIAGLFLFASFMTL
mmetsp:Transcript_37025/g.60437  ORF Transcript_37025/g.60437 Transcript_37025/m.60437 type:complete len:108 (+) Transcript_37025:1-324(+)